jgi:hypothetical protein
MLILEQKTLFQGSDGMPFENLGRIACGILGCISHSVFMEFFGTYCCLKMSPFS